jgi:hypothetical protein
MFFNLDSNVDSPLVDPLAGPLDLRIFPTGGAQSVAAVLAVAAFVLWLLLV